MASTGTALPDPVAQAAQNYISRDQPPDHLLTLSRRAPAFVIISAPYTGGLWGNCGESGEKMSASYSGKYIDKFNRTFGNPHHEIVFAS